MPNEPKQIAIVRPKYPLRIKSPQHTNIKIPGAQPTATAIEKQAEQLASRYDSIFENAISLGW